MITGINQYPELTKPLTAKSGTHAITANWLLNQPNLILEHPNIKWLDEAFLVYALPRVRENETWAIYTINIST